jgi:nitronate monooxygenase
MIVTEVNNQLNVRLPFILAPMFLVSNKAMMIAAIEAGIMGVFPSLNYRKDHELENIIQTLHEVTKDGKQGNFGVNLIVQQSNPLYKKHLKICIDGKVPFIITSLGNPGEVIKLAHEYGGKVYCDVTNITHAEKSASLNCDGFIAVGSGAGGHAGTHPNYILVPALRQKFPHLPVIAAGGIATGEGILSMIACGAEGVSIGTRFIASVEADVPVDYKKAIIDFGMEDIVMTTKLSGTPCAVINTGYAKKIGYNQNWIEKWLSRNQKTKKYFKMLVNIRGLKMLEKAVQPGTYKNLWCAGQSIEMIHDIQSCAKIIADLESELYIADNRLKKIIAD